MKKLFTAFVFLLGALATQAQTISVQGVLRDPNGRSVDDGAHNITFAIYNQASGGSALWQENYPSLQTNHGVFQANLGANTSFGSLAFDTTYYVGVTVDNYPEMSPRIVLGVYPYSKAIMGQENKFPSTGNVVLNRDSIIVKKGALKLEGPDGRIVFNDGTSLNTAEFGGPAASLLNPTSININADKDAMGSGNINLQIAGQLKAQLNNNGNFGIGVQGPDNALDLETDDFFMTEFKGNDPNGAGIQIHSTGHNWEMTATGSNDGSGSLYFYDQTAGANRLNIGGDGTVDIGGRVNAGLLYSSDQVQAANSVLANYGYFGVDDQTFGGATFYGPATGEGAELDLYTSAEFDNIIDYYYLDIFEDDFRIGALGYGDVAKFTSEGKVGIGYSSPTSRLHVSSFGQLSLTNPGALTLGGDDSSNMVFDDNDIQARNNGAANTLWLNTLGGDIWMGAGGDNITLTVGQEDTGGQSTIALKGAGTGDNQGGELQLFTAADYDTNINYWYLNAVDEGFRIGSVGNAANGDAMTFANGNVGIGDVNPTAGKLVVGGFTNVTDYGAYFLHTNSSKDGYTEGSFGVGRNFVGNGNDAQFPHYANVSISASNVIATPELILFSDQRIKKNFAVSDNSKDLELLKKIKVTDYQMIDSIAQGDKIYKKVIAQQVEEVLPDAVSLTKNFIPSVYRPAISNEFNASTHKSTITVDKVIDFQIGDLVKLITDKGEVSKEVVTINNEYEFVVSSDVEMKKVFVFGKKVDDFRTVDYDAISMLNVSATQELARQLEKQQQLIADLKAENESLKDKLKKVDILEAKLNILLENQTNDKPVQSLLIGKQ